MAHAVRVTQSFQCPSCDYYVTTNPHLIAGLDTPMAARYTDELGVERNMDIFPYMMAESYRIIHPPEVLAGRALHHMCINGAVDDIIWLVKADVTSGYLNALALYQEPLADMKSALHFAVEYRRERAIWLMLWLASTIPSGSFPNRIRSSLKFRGVLRLYIRDGVDIDLDIRSLHDSHGRTAQHIAQAASWGGERGELTEALSPP